MDWNPESSVRGGEVRPTGLLATPPQGRGQSLSSKVLRCRTTPPPFPSGPSGGGRGRPRRRWRDTRCRSTRRSPAGTSGAPTGSGSTAASGKLGGDGRNLRRTRPQASSPIATPPPLGKVTPRVEIAVQQPTTPRGTDAGPFGFRHNLTSSPLTLIIIHYTLLYIYHCGAQMSHPPKGDDAYTSELENRDTGLRLGSLSQLVHFC